jgi:enterochelin esterase-like enzyme
VERLLLGSSAGGAAALLQASAAADAAGAVGSVSGSGSQRRQAVMTVPGTDVTRQLSAVKTVSAVMDVDAREFHSYILERLRM